MISHYLLQGPPVECLRVRHRSRPIRSSNGRCESSFLGRRKSPGKMCGVVCNRDRPSNVAAVDGSVFISGHRVIAMVMKILIAR